MDLIVILHFKLHRIGYYGQKEEYNMKNLVEPIKNKKDIERIEQYLTKHSLRNRLIFVFGCNTGLRISDILALNVEDVQNKQYVEIVEKKTKKHKRFPLNNKLCKLIKEYLEIERNKTYVLGEEEPLFVGKKHCRLDRSQVYRFINEACTELQIQGNYGTHSCRKSMGYHHYKQNHDVALLQKIFNHSSPSITMRYIGIDQEEIDEAYINFEL